MIIHIFTFLIESFEAAGIQERLLRDGFLRWIFWFFCKLLKQFTTHLLFLRLKLCLAQSHVRTQFMVNHINQRPRMLCTFPFLLVVLLLVPCITSRTHSLLFQFFLVLFLFTFLWSWCKIQVLLDNFHQLFIFNYDCNPFLLISLLLLIVATIF